MKVITDYNYIYNWLRIHCIWKWGLWLLEIMYWITINYDYYMPRKKYVCTAVCIYVCMCMHNKFCLCVGSVCVVVSEKALEQRITNQEYIWLIHLGSKNLNWLFQLMHLNSHQCISICLFVCFQAHMCVIV